MAYAYSSHIINESFIISKWISKQITNLPQNNANYTTKKDKEEKNPQLLRMKRQSEDTLKSIR